MNNANKKEIIENMLNISIAIRDRLQENNKQIENISYYEDFQFKGTNFGVENAYVVKIKDDTVPEDERNLRKEDNIKEEYIYEIYDENNNLIALVNKNGEIIFNQVYMEGLRGKNKLYFNQLDLVLMSI